MSSVITYDVSVIFLSTLVKVIVFMFQSGDRIEGLNSEATNWIKHKLQNGSWVSIITFTETGTLVMDFVQIVGDASRTKIASFIPMHADGGTCICNGLHLALKVRAWTCRKTK